jgi:hypothetical protein
MALVPAWLLFGLFQCVGFLEGVNVFFGWPWWVGLIIFFMSLGLGTLGGLLTVAFTFYGAWKGWGWPWYGAVAFAAPFPFLALATGGAVGLYGIASKLRASISPAQSAPPAPALAISPSSSTAIEERAKLLGRMIPLIVGGLRSKSYDAFIAAFSNPGNEPTASDRAARRAHFRLQLSSSCWYDAIASYALGAPPWVVLRGGGDDFGVVIRTGPEHRGVTLDYDSSKGSLGPDAFEMIAALHRTVEGAHAMGEVVRL